MEIPKRVRGTQDWSGEDQRYYTFLKKVSRHIFRRSGFTRISTPILESKDLIVRSSGSTTDVVSKELYDVIDKKGRELCLKPESTAGIMRAYLDRFLDDPQPTYLYYIEPHFRYDRPQKGRFRQFHQIGSEIIGEKDPVLDAESIHIACEILNIIGLKGKYTVKINSLGNAKEREKYLEELQGFFETKRHLLDETDIVRLEQNPLRLLDSKNPDLQEILPYAPKLSDCFKKDSKLYYEQAKEYLALLGVEFEEDPTLVRGLDYYSDIVFELVDNSGRSQDAFGGGGRYDELATSIGAKKPVPAVGFALGVERMIDGMKDSGYSIQNKDAIDFILSRLETRRKKYLFLFL